MAACDGPSNELGHCRINRPVRRIRHPHLYPRSVTPSSPGHRPGVTSLGLCDGPPAALRSGGCRWLGASQWRCAKVVIRAASTFGSLAPTSTLNPMALQSEVVGIDRKDSNPTKNKQKQSKIYAYLELSLCLPNELNIQTKCTWDRHGTWSQGEDEQPTNEIRPCEN